MVRLKIFLFLASILIAPIACAQGTPSSGTSDNAATAIPKVQSYPAELPNPASLTDAPWPVETSLKATLRIWTQRQGWPAPQFLTEADWAVDVPGSIAGSIENALKALAEGFGKSPTRPRFELSANHVILVSEAEAE